jgi:myo-inositol 2-dehydrogenase / D-chiro-inositol 1-dehydrogenase
MRCQGSSRQRGMTRRALLGRALGAMAGAAAAPYLVPGSAMGADGTTAPSERITIGMIGVGRQVVALNLPFFLDAPDAQVVALCDVDRWRLELESERLVKIYGGDVLRRKVQGVAKTQDYREVIGRDDVDAVMISTSDQWHVPISIAAVEAGKDVCCEKPLTRYIAEGRRLADLVSKHRRVFRTDSEFRSIPHFHRAVELVRNGAIGRLKTIRCGVPFGPASSPAHVDMPVPEELDYEMWQGPAPRRPYTEQRVHQRRGYERPGWMNILDYCDGMITNWGTHLCDIGQWGNDSDETGPVEVEGRGEYVPAGGLWNVLRSFEVRYRYADGVEMFYKTETPYTRFEGTEGWIQADYPRGLTAEPESILGVELGPDAVRFPLKHEKRDFLDCVKTRGRTLADAEVGHRTTSLCHLGHIAIQVGKPLRWDPEKERFLDSDEANALVGKPVFEPRYE